MTVWYGVAADKPTCDALLNAISRFCSCGRNNAGAVVAPCPSHAALAERAAPRKATWIERLLCERQRAAELVAEEWCQSDPVQTVEPQRTTPTPPDQCTCGHWDSLHYGPFDRHSGCFAPWCRCSGFTTRSQSQPAGDDLVRVRYGNGFAWFRKAA